MTLISSIKFTPELLIEAPRRSAAVVNTAGTHAIYSVSTYDLAAHREYKETRILKIEDASSNLFSTDSGDSDPQWLGDSDLILYQHSTDNEDTELWIANGIGEKRSYYAGKIESAAGDLKATQLKNGNVAIVFSAPTNPKGEIFNPKSADTPKHTGREYTKHPIRAWDTWNPLHRFSLYYMVISKQSDGKWKLNSEKPVNALRGTKLQFPLAPGGILGENGGFTIGPRGIILCALDPSQNMAMTLILRAYFIALDTFEEKKPKVVRLKNDGYIGSASGACFSQSGNLAAFVVCRTEFEMGCEKGIAWVDLDDEKLYQESHIDTNLCKFTDGKSPTWDRWPGDLAWSHDDKALFIETEDNGYHQLFKLDMEVVLSQSSDRNKVVKAPVQLTNERSSISSFELLDRNNARGNKVLLTSSSYTEPSLYSILDTSTGKIDSLSSISNNGEDLGLKPEQAESITFPGDKSEIQAHIVRPSHFDPSKKYPLALLVHGGPQGSWTSAWSTRWNAALWAEQGYIVLMPNPSGSTGFGLELATSVSGDWGGRPYRDIEKSVTYVCENFSYVDSSTIIMAGGSFGGYMAFWIAGQPLAKKLKAIVSHDGVFHMSSGYAADYVGDWGKEVGSQLWEDIKPWEKWSPANYAKNWETPMLIIHSDLDYRCTINEGLGAYAVLQAKGVPSRFLYFPDENHWVLKRENSLKWQRTVLGWFNYYAGIKHGVQLEEANGDPKFDEDDEPEQKDENPQTEKK